MKFKNFQIQLGKNKENPESDADETSDVMVNQIANLEEQVNGKTKELEETEQQLKELSDTVQEAEEESPPQPHGPLGELTLEPEDIGAEEVDTSTLFEDDDQGAPVVEVIKAETPAPANEASVTEVSATEESVTEESATEEAASQTPPAAIDNSLSSLFSDDEEEEAPLATLIQAMPDVTPQELLDDLNEIHNILKYWQRK